MSMPIEMAALLREACEPSFPDLQSPHPVTRQLGGAGDTGLTMTDDNQALPTQALTASVGRSGCNAP